MTRTQQRILKPSELKKITGNAPAQAPASSNDDAQLRQGIVDAAKAAGQARQATRNPFPIEALHPVLQEFCKSHHACYGFPLDWYGCGILAISGVLIGNAYAAEYQPNWYGSPTGWYGLVGRSSSGKTQVMKHIERPLKRIQDDLFDRHSAILEQWRIEQENKKQSGKASQEQAPPQPARLLLKKFSLEKAVTIMQQNQRALLVSRSELIGWMRAMNQYRKGDDEQVWLEFWDNDDQLIDMVKYDLPIYLRRTNMTVWGGVQDDLLHEMADGQKQESGHLGRFLFAYSDDLDKPMPAKIIPAPDIVEKWDKTCVLLHQCHNLISSEQVKSIMIPFSAPAKEAYFKFLCSSTDAQNRAENNLQRSILGKLETYVLRFACMLALTDHAAAGKTITSDEVIFDKNQRAEVKGLEITEEILVRALMLKDYFRATSLKVTTRIESPVNKLPPDQQDWYRALPFDEMFKTRTALDTATDLNIAQRTAETLLSNLNLFKKIKTGWYERRWF